MALALVSYLLQRPDAATFFLPFDLARTVEEVFPDVSILPQPYKIFLADETQPPALGFPVAETAVLKDLEMRLDRWVTDETSAIVVRDQPSKERAQLALSGYMGQLMKVAENALVSNLLNDYHAVFWLAHSIDLARHFSGIPRRVSTMDTQMGRTHGDAIKYRVFSRWATETREQMTQVVARNAAMLDGEEQRAFSFFRLLQDDVLLLTEEFVGPDLRELRSFITGYLRRDFNTFRESFEKMRTIAAELVQRDLTFRSALRLLGVAPEQGVTLSLMLEPRFLAFLSEQQAMQNAVTREDREQFALVAKRVREFAVLNQLRRGITWLVTGPDGQIVAADRKNGGLYSRSTRPLDFGRPGVLDPMVHRFGLIYDISSFTETLGSIRRGGGKEEIRSYRQMLLFQRRMESIAQRHLLQFEKFLGDGAFYTTRRAMRLVRASIEIQRFYSEMKRKGFAFNKGLRVAVNYGYYRLLPMKTGGADSSERITEFYGPGIVELSRLTTGKASKEIEDVAALLIAHGYEERKVRQFFAPLSQGVDTVDHTQHAREFYGYVNGNGHLMNEGIVASSWFLQELSAEIAHEALQLWRLKAPWGTYIGFSPALSGVEYVGIRLLGMVSLKGLDKIDVGEITPFGPEEVEATPIDVAEPLVMLLRQEYHQDDDTGTSSSSSSESPITTSDREIETAIVIAIPADSYDLADEVVIGEWNPATDILHRPLRMPRGDFQRLFSLKGELTSALIETRKQTIRELYYRLCEREQQDDVRFSDLRVQAAMDTYVVSEAGEKL